MEAIRQRLEPLFSKYSASSDTLTLKRFYQMCTDAALVGPQLSRNQVKMAFVSSLNIGGLRLG